MADLAGRDEILAPLVREVSHVTVPETVPLGLAASFDELVGIIERAKLNAYRAVNRELIGMYWDIGQYISASLRSGTWGEGVIQQFSEYVQRLFPGIQGFSASNVWRMRQFYDLYSNNEKLAPLVREIPWTHNLIIMSMVKTDEAKEFYLRQCANEHWSKRDLERQIDSMLFERIALSTEKHQLLIEQRPQLSVLRDSYSLEFLELPEEHCEIDLRRAIITHLKQFILEFGRDFTYVGEEYRVQVGLSDFPIDLLLYHRGLACLVAIELKRGKFKPEHLGKLSFYLEALDRDVKKGTENPSVGLILCQDKDDTVVEYAMSRTLSPAMVAEYQLHLPDKQMLEAKLRELAQAGELSGDDVG
ncbi:MAG: PDDEXK nuclease domain-containing protein [Propionibacteriaceae bacterium]|nr:PDDEXK nuclease domain-containing protein [Propionibacteriaceae bacterium]